MTEADVMRRDYFSALAYDDERCIFYLSPDALGFGFQLAPLASNDPAIGEKLNTLLNLPFPAGTLIQVAMYASPDIEAALVSYQQMRQGKSNAILREVTKQRVEFLRAATEQPVDRVSGVHIHDVKILITVRVPIGRAEPDESDFEKVGNLRAAFGACLRSSGVRGVPLTAERYLRFMATCLNHKPTATWRETAEERYDPTRLLCDQILDGDNAIEIDAKGLWLGETRRVRLLHAKHYPALVDFGLAMRYLGDYISGDRGIREPVLMTANIYYIDHEARAGRLQSEVALVQNQMQGPAARYVNGIKYKLESLTSTVKAVEEGDRLVQCYLGIAVMAKSEAASIEAVTNARTYFSEMQFKLMEDHFMCGPLFGQLLPFAADAVLRKSLSRYCTMPTRVAVCLLPVMGAWQGTGSAMLTLFSRDGQLMPISPYDSDTNYNICIAAASGSGKSFLVNELIANFLATKGRAWVIDIGGSYKNLCQLMGGTYLQFNRDTTINLNPFRQVEDYTEESDILVGILTAMAAPSQTLTDLQSAELRREVRELWDADGRAATIDGLAQRLGAHHDTRVQDVGRQLFPFTLAGEYGRFFSGDGDPFNADSPFIVCELEELRGRAHLQRVVLMQLMYQIQQKMYLGDRSVPKLLVIDEAWDLLAKGDAKEFIVGSYRRARKYRGSIVTVTQSVMDYWRNEGAEAIVENSANWYLLKQKAESIAMVEKEKRLPFGPAGYTLLQSVRTVPGAFSEIFALTERGMGIGRLVVSDFNQLLYTTTPDEAQALRNLEAQGMPIEVAIHTLMQRSATRRSA